MSGSEAEEAPPEDQQQQLEEPEVEVSSEPEMEPPSTVGGDVKDVPPRTGKKRPAYDDLDDPDLGGTMEPQKKLCRFYFLDECSRADQCYFMHADFPCKFYYFGYECRDGKKCRLHHGKALDEEMKRILWRHVTTAPANLMQRFPCFPSALLRQNFEDRHQELLLMEQEGLLDEDLGAELSESISDTLLGEVIKTVAINQMIDDKLGDLGEMAGILSTEQIAMLAKMGIKTKEQLFQLGASSMMELGFDYDTIVAIGNFKESHRKQSIYEEDKSEDVPLPDPSTLDALDTELDLSQPGVPALSDQELLSILNDERDAAAAAAEEGLGAAEEITNTSLATTLEGSFTTDCSDASGSAEKVRGNGPERSKTTTLEATSLLADASSSSNDSTDKLQFLLYAAVKEKENDPKARESTARTVEQLCRVDSLVNEGHRQPEFLFGSDSESNQSGSFRLPFKSIIDKYTPAKEIDAGRGQIVGYRLIPIDIPRPNFEALRQSFVTEPTFSLDPRLQLLFKIGPTEVRPVVTNGGGGGPVQIRDPRLKRAIEVATANGLVEAKSDEESNWA